MACQSKPDEVGLDSVVTEHFEAIVARDIDRLVETVDKEGVSLILPSGTYTTSFEAYQQVNVDWFADRSWSIIYEVMEKTVRQETAIVLTKINYTATDKAGKASSFPYYLTLIFALDSEGEWKLDFDQNTLIR